MDGRNAIKPPMIVPGLDLEPSGNLVQNQINKFAMIQVSQTVEFWCEITIIENLSSIFVETDDRAITREMQRRLILRIKEYFSTVISRTIWPVTDLQHY